MEHSNVCTHIKACKGTKHPKLALFAQFCYPDGSFKSGNTQEIETLLHSNIGHRADDKGSNRFLKRLTPSFKTAGAFAMGATMMLSSPVFANDSASNQVTPTQAAMNTTAPATVTQAMTVAEIRKDPDFYKDKIILQYDDTVVDVDITVEVLLRRGFDAFSVPAGNDGCGVRLILSGFTGDKLCFTQSNLDRGEVASLAINLLPKVQARQAARQAQATTGIQHASLEQ